MILKGGFSRLWPRGTSLINANVVIESEPRVFKNPVWPKALIDVERNNTGNSQKLLDFAKKNYQLRPNSESKFLLAKSY